MQSHAQGTLTDAAMNDQFDAAVKDTLRRFEEAGETIVTDGEQRKSSFATYPLTGLANLAGGGVTIPFVDGHTRQLPVITGGPFRYGAYAASYLTAAKPHTKRTLKQAVISASALSLLYPQGGIAGYDQAAFIKDLVAEAVKDLRLALEAGAHVVQIDFTEARLSLKLDPSGGLLQQFVDLNNQVLEHFTAAERTKLGVHTCPGGDHDSTHSADIPYAQLLPTLFKLNVGNFYVQLASEQDRPGVLKLLGELAGDRRIFVGVTDPCTSRIETEQEVEQRVLEAAKYIKPELLGTTDDCGFSPFGDDTSTSRDTAFAKIRARVAGTARASKTLGV
jgi:5-methyltetrahydropteroyltriglutamate--homocysteine methyltransferase